MSSSSSELARASFLLSEGLDKDEAGDADAAAENYTEAVELCLRSRGATDNAELKRKLTELATHALERAEAIKRVQRGAAARPAAAPSPARRQNAASLGLDALNLHDLPAPPEDAPETPPVSNEGPVAGAAFVAPAGPGYTDEEKKVLATTSLINGREYVPFLTVDLKEKFAFPVPFSDKHGKLALAPKQKAKLVGWMRPEEFMRGEPEVLQVVDCFSVTQTVVSDCSFVASIAIAAQYEKRFRKRLITSLIYPQNRRGEPVYNPCGKYMVRLRVNGVPRKVIVDDLFPIGPGREPLCSYSSNRNELWISLLEKAYMKVMGGYDFPGSNSNIDLYALTGWIPERVAIRPGDPSFDKEAVFKKLQSRFHKGDVLVTVATGEMSDAEADRAGLVPTHAYAMLDVREVDGVKLFLLKNPWAHLRWKGNYSETDARHWTPQMMKALNYDPKDAQHYDNGVFWIDYDSLCRFYDVIYMNWNPALFRHTFTVHHVWAAGAGPAKDLYNISSNPQFSLELGPGTGALWILLSRHITDIEDFKNNKEYITLLVYKNEGRKVYYPFDPPPFIDGVRINSPHYLCQTVVSESTPRRLTLVVSQFEKSTTIYFTVKVLSTLPFTLRRLVNPYRHRHEVRAEWRGRSAGGCANNRDTYPNNPRFQFTAPADCHVLLELRAPKQYQVGFDVVCVVAGNKESPLHFRSKQSGAYKSGFVVLPLEITAGTYDVVPATFRPGQEGPFFLKLEASIPLKLARMQ